MMQTDEKNSSSSDHYNFIAKLNHWITAVLVLTNLALGLHMEHFPGYGHKTPEWNAVLFYHASIGMLVLWITVFRLYWRLTHKTPPLSFLHARVAEGNRLSLPRAHLFLYSSAPLKWVRTPPIGWTFSDFLWSFHLACPL